MTAGHMPVYMQMTRCQRGKSSRLCRRTGSFLTVTVTNLSTNRSNLNSCNFVVSWRIELKFVALESWRVSFFYNKSFVAKRWGLRNHPRSPLKGTISEVRVHAGFDHLIFFCSQRKKELKFPSNNSMVVHVISFNHTVNIVKKSLSPSSALCTFSWRGCFVSVVCLQIAEHNNHLSLSPLSLSLSLSLLSLFLSLSSLSLSLLSPLSLPLSSLSSLSPLSLLSL